MTEAHALLAPSSAARWMQCGRSPSMEAAFPEEEESEAAREGTAAHWWWSEAMAGKTRTGVASNGALITDEMVEHGTTLMERILSVAPQAEVIVEAQIRNPVIHPDNWGTPDAFWYDATTHTLYIWDYKYGHGYVGAYRNWQLINYGALISAFLGLDTTSLRFVFTIFQPRNYSADGPFREWWVEGGEILSLIRQMQSSAKVAGPDSRAVSGPECKNCKARHGCAVLQAVAYSVVEITGYTMPEALSERALGKELALLKQAEERLKARITGLEEDAKARLKSGKVLQGWMLEQGFGREVWTVSPDEVFALGDMMGLDLRKKAEAITPAQARKLGLDEDVSKAYSKRPPGEVKLVPASLEALGK